MGLDLRADPLQPCRLDEEDKSTICNKTIASCKDNMLDISCLPPFVSLNKPSNARFRELLCDMRNRSCFEALPTSCAVLSAEQTMPLVRESLNLRVMLVDVPASLEALVTRWLQRNPVPALYQGSVQEPLTCLQFREDRATLCLDVECIGTELIEARERSIQLLLCVAVGEKLHLKLLDHGLLCDAEFVAAFEDCFYEAAAERANHYRHISGGDWDFEEMATELAQAYEGDVYIAAVPLRLTV